MNDNEVMSKVLRWMISQAKNKEYIEKLNIILWGIEGYRNIEETKHPRFQSIILFGINIFPLSINDYREMVKLIEE